MRRLRTLALGLILAVPALAPAAAGSAPACAAEASGSSHAALVVDTGSRTTTYCVALDASSVSGIHLIQLAGSQFGLQYSLGFGGQAVCSLNGVGVSGGDCFGDYPNFWGYWHGDGSGGWSWAGSGAASASIGDGDMEGWVWGSGDSGTTHAAPPALAFDDVCSSTTPSPSPSPGTGGGGNTGGGSGGGGNGGADHPGASNGGTTTGSGPAPSSPSVEGSGGPDRSDDDTTNDRSPHPTIEDSPIVQASPVTELAAGLAGDEPGGGPPAGALVALIAVAALGLGGWFLRRRQIAREGD